PVAHRCLHSFPTRRSSDLLLVVVAAGQLDRGLVGLGAAVGEKGPLKAGQLEKARRELGLSRVVVEVRRVQQRLGRLLNRRLHPRDRKSTRLNSSHVKISYA